MLHRLQSNPLPTHRFERLALKLVTLLGLRRVENHHAQPGACAITPCSSYV